MAKRVVTVYSVRTGKPLGKMIDPGDGGMPFGVPAGVDSMLVGGSGDRQENFERYHSGHSNGYYRTEAGTVAA